MEDGRFDYPPFSAQVSVGYPRNDGRRSTLPSPRRPRPRSQRTPSLPGRHRDALGKRSAPLRCRRDRQWMGARRVR